MQTSHRGQRECSSALPAKLNQPGLPLAGLLTYASSRSDSPSQDASQWLMTNCQNSQRLQLRGSDGFTPSSQHQISQRLSRPQVEVKFAKPLQLVED